SRLAATDAPIEASIAVIVVPKLSPNKTGTAACKSIACSENKPCKIPMVALELWTINVNTVPIATPKKALSDILSVSSWNTSKSFKGAIPRSLISNQKIKHQIQKQLVLSY